MRKNFQPRLILMITMSRIVGYSCLYRVYAINLKVRQSIDIQLINALSAEREALELILSQNIIKLQTTDNQV